MLVAEETKLSTIAEYLQAEDAAAVRHEFENGKINEMAGGTLAHNAVKGEVYTFINLGIKAAKMPHMVLNSDTKVRIEATNRFVYPDVTISDGTPAYYTTPDGYIRRDIITNPLVIIEVLSGETRDYDKGGKFERYGSIPGFQEYILIEPETVWAKNAYLQAPDENLWKIEYFTDPAAELPIRSLGLTIPLSELYAVLGKLPE